MVNMEIGDSKKVECPLIEATKAGDLDSLRRLLDKGANIFETGSGGGTALHFACDNGKKYENMAIFSYDPCFYGPWNTFPISS
jgi:ankyrin repeat protein